MKRNLLGYAKTVFAIALPVTAQRVVEFVLMATDSAFIGMYDQAGYSALNNSIWPFFTLFSFFFAIAQGITIVISQQIGAKRRLLGRRFAEVSLFYNCLISFAYLAFWLLSSGAVLRMMGAQGRVLELGESYLSMLSLQFLTVGLGLTANAIFQSDGKTKPGMIMTFLKVALNIFLDWVMIFGNLGFPAMGIAGAGLATSLSAMMGDLILFFWLIRSRFLKIRFAKVFKPHFPLFGKVMRLGIPVGMEYLLWSVGQTVMTGMINQVDSVSSGHFLILMNFIVLSINLFDGIGTAGMVLVGQATGAKDPKEARYAASFAIIASQAVCALVMMVYLFLPEGLLSIYIRNPAELSYLAPILTLFGVSSFFKALNITSGNSIRGTGNTLWMLYTQIGGTIFIIAASAFFIFGMGLGLLSLILAVILDEGIRGLINAVKFYAAQNKAVRLHEEAERQAA
jgi:putative MATE family efflux protein